MQNKVELNRIAVNLWTARIVPIILAGVVGYATYVVVALLCVNYLLIKHNDHAAAISILVIYFVLFILMAVCFFRLVYITIFEPPYVPLGPRALRERTKDRAESQASSDKSGISGAKYNTGASMDLETSGIVAGSENDPDSPGLELFYTKDVFVCDMDGKPKWCTQCANWKPDRAHHSKDCGRCIRKMDHFCPWVGGAVGENNFKFFIQFTGYTALYCIHVLVVTAIYVAKQRKAVDETLNPQFAVVLGLATFFGLFTFGMTVTSIDLAMDNYTQVEKIGAKYAVHILAVLKPPRIEMVRSDAAVPQYYKEITYPLDAGMPPSSDYYQPADLPRTKIFSHARLSEPIENPPLPTSEDIGKSSAAPMQGAEGSHPNRGPLKTNEIPAAVDLLQESLDESSGMGLENGASMQQVPRPAESTAESTAWTGDRQIATARERLSERDLQATRTFAILQMLQTGENPWDLGSRILNFKTVMGSNLLDWFLPIQRSPCCNHEEGESQFALGPAVELLKSSVGFIPPREPGTLRRRRRKRTRRRTRSEDAPDLDVKTSDSNAIATQPNPSIPLQDFNDSSTSPRPA